MGNILSTSIWPDMAISLHSLLLLEEWQCHGARGRKRKRRSNRKCNRSFILNEIDHLTELEFGKMFRMRRDSFEKLYRTLETLLYTPNAAMSWWSSGSIISKKTKLYCTLRWLAGGSYLTFALLMVCLDLASFLQVTRVVLYGQWLMPSILLSKLAFQGTEMNYWSLQMDSPDLPVGSYLVCFCNWWLGVQNMKASSIRGRQCNGILKSAWLLGASCLGWMWCWLSLQHFFLHVFWFN